MKGCYCIDSQTVHHVVLNQEYIFSDIINYLWDRKSNWSIKNIYDWVTYERVNTIVLLRIFCPVCIIEFGHTYILSDYVRLPMPKKNPEFISFLRTEMTQVVETLPLYILSDYVRLPMPKKPPEFISFLRTEMTQVVETLPHIIEYTRDDVRRTRAVAV